MNVKEIVFEYLVKRGYDGLYRESCVNCRCKIDNLMPCGLNGIQLCKPGYIGDCDCDKGCDFHIGPEK